MELLGDATLGCIVGWLEDDEEEIVVELSNLSDKTTFLLTVEVVLVVDGVITDSEEVEDVFKAFSAGEDVFSADLSVVLSGFAF